MSEIIYKLFFFIVLVMIVSFIHYEMLKLKHLKQLHGLDFTNIDKNFQISGMEFLDYKKNNIIYISGAIPSSCVNIGKYSIRCLADIKKYKVGVYNGRVFYTGDNFYKQN